MNILLFTRDHSAVSEYPGDYFHFRVGAPYDIDGRRTAGGKLHFLSLLGSAFIAEAVYAIAVCVISVITFLKVHIMQDQKTGCHADSQSQDGTR